MLMAHPVVLKGLVERYESLRSAAAEDARERRRLEDVEYTLCVSTGTRDVESALDAARTRLACGETTGTLMSA
ncbi:DUF5133 domain-containing protein [Streptomyces sp. NPDC008125]|uniref:DUF5133 domain-containing protein n=1 Tax=Streptomyces sp. NPDC008125 TaxID=3364811 RepID=UPI0036EDA8CC